jgi:F-type H+-transporting ATPase subunit epsilon
MSKNVLTLNIVTLEGSVFSGSVTKVIVNGELGDLGIFPNHAPLLSSISPGPLRYYEVKTTEPSVIYTSGGIMEVSRNTVTLLADKCVRAKELDLERIKEAKAHAEKLLSQKETTKSIEQARAELIRVAAMTRTLEELRRLVK